MSFILDALRKSEHARQRQTGPGLAEVPVAATKPRTNAWATAAIALLVVNLVAVGVLLLRRAHKDETAATVPTATSPANQAPVAANPTLNAPAITAQPQVPVSQVAAAPAAPPAPRDETNAAADLAVRNPLADEVVDGPDQGYAAERQLAAASVPAGPAAVTTNGNVRRGSVVYAPMAEADDPADVPAVEPQRAVRQSATPALPGADELAARGGMPALHLDLHVYSNQPQQRFVFVNSRKYKEGDTLAEGPVVEQITPDGAVLNFQGSRYRLSND